MRHNDPVKAGNIVYWDGDKTFPSVVMYVTTPKWKSNTQGTRYARVTHLDTFTIWVEASKLIVAKDIRTSNSKKQLENLAAFVQELHEKKYPKFSS